MEVTRKEFKDLHIYWEQKRRTDTIHISDRAIGLPLVGLRERREKNRSKRGTGKNKRKQPTKGKGEKKKKEDHIRICCSIEKTLALGPKYKKYPR